MMGCQPQTSSHLSASHAHAHYTVASHSRLQETLSVSQPVDSPPYFVHSSSSVLPSTHHQGAQNLGQRVLSETEPASSSYLPLSTDPVDLPSGVHPSPHPNTVAQCQQQQQHLAFPEVASTSQFQCPGVSAPRPLLWPTSGIAPQLSLSHPPQQQKAVSRPPHSATPQSFSPHQSSSLHTSQQSAPSQKQELASLEETNISEQRFGEPKEHQQCSRSPAVSLLHPPSSFAGRPTDSSSCVTSDTHSRQKASSHHWQSETHSPLQYQLSSTGYSSTMLDKKPTLQVVTTDHSPISPGSSTSSPRFVFPDMQASSSSGHLGSDSGSSPFMSPVKHEVKLEIGTPPQSSEVESTLLQHERERRRMYSGDTELSETLVDSETGSSLLEDSSSSREQSPFSAMAESLSLRSPSEHSPSPLTRKNLPHQTFFVASEEEEHAERGEEGVEAATSQPDPEFHHSKFKRRLHERYVLSLKDTSQCDRKVKEESMERIESCEEESHSDSKRPSSKMERSESPQHTDSPMPKSPRRSSSDTDMVQAESAEVGASSADEGDVFMEPTMHVRTKHKPPSLHQREPLDLSRGPFYSGFRSSSGSSPLIDTEHLSPASKIFSPVFRSPHRLPYSPHGLMSPQSQSPLCSVPEGGRIFNFNVPSPHEGPHSDSDLISPSPMSPRIFTFPPPGSIPNPMSEVNRLAVSPRAPYTPPPAFLRGKPVGGGGVPDPKWGDQQDFYSKRSLSESDVTYLCPVCGQVFPTNDNLAKHMTKHLPSETIRAGDNNKVHYCKVCNRSFSRSDMLTRHMRLHTGLKPYECMECGQVFSRSDHLNTHRRTHTGEKPYRCPHCPYAACRRDMITRHMRTHAKRTSRRARYLSVPDDGDTHKASGSISSTDTIDSQEYSTGIHTCSVSSVDSVESESVHSPHPTYLGTSVDSLLSPGPLSSPSSRKPSEELDEGMEGQEGGSGSNRFMHYRKVRNWSTTSLESVDSEEAVLIREVLVDDAFHDPDPHPSLSAGEGGSREGMGHISQGISSSSKDMGGLDTKTLQKCFISSQPPGSSSS